MPPGAEKADPVSTGSLPAIVGSRRVEAVK
jgi:hypothetical protein